MVHGDTRASIHSAHYVIHTHGEDVSRDERSEAGEGCATLIVHTGASLPHTHPHTSAHTDINNERARTQAHTILMNRLINAVAAESYNH